VAVLLAVLSGSTGCGEPLADPGTTIVEAVAAGLPRLRPVVLGTMPHERGTWTEGLEISGGVLYESTGLAGQSQLRALDPGTGRLLRAVPLADHRYGESITMLGATIWQLTYRDHLALRWEQHGGSVGGAARGPAALPGRRMGAVPHHRPPRWTRCPAGGQRRLSQLRLLSPTDLAPLGQVSVRVRGRSLTGLNGLECVTDSVWANVPRSTVLSSAASDTLAAHLGSRSDPRRGPSSLTRRRVRLVWRAGCAGRPLGVGGVLGAASLARHVTTWFQTRSRRLA
jgi:glutaminyl-peptide cyclotransferase